MSNQPDKPKAVGCSAKLDDEREIECVQEDGHFYFKFTNKGAVQKLKITNQAAIVIREMIGAMHPSIVIREMIGAMHPSILNTNNPLWHRVQAVRKANK